MFITKPESGKEEQNEGGVNRQTGLGILQLDKQASAKTCLTELKDNGHVGISFLIMANVLKRISNFRTFKIQGFSTSGRQLLGFVIVVCFLHLIYLRRLHMYVLQHPRGGQGTICESWFSPLTV